MLKKEYENLLNKEEIKEKALIEESDKFVKLRLTVFLLGVVLSGILFYLKIVIPAALVLSLFLMLFFILVKKHRGVREKQRRSRALIEYFSNFVKRISGEWTEFNDMGEEFIDPKHPYTSDLNIFGPKSLFQLINLTHTFRGRHSLANLLKNPNTDKALIAGRQEAIKELAQKPDFVKELSLIGLLEKKKAKNPLSLIESMNEKDNVPSILKNPLLIIGLPIITLISSLLAGRIFPSLYIVLMVGLILQILLFALSIRLVSGRLASVNQHKNELEAYYSMLKLVESTEFNSQYLNKKKDMLYYKGHSASNEIKRLAALSDFVDFKYSPLIHFILNSLFLWDLNLYRLLQKWKRLNVQRISQWLDILAEFEALASLCVIPMISPVYTYPEFDHENPVFYARDLAHPFIPYEKRVSNHVEIKGIGIITGSNMSGKTTLLRTIGVNLVLAYAGAPVIASYLKTGVMNVLTSMRNQDDLNEGISTFYAELVRIKGIVDKSKDGHNMIFLIDEIFKGTNSRDRIEGAKSVLKGLDKPWVIGLITTHDYELCDLENENNRLFSNWNFTETYVSNRIHFDYKLHKGRCTSSNARYLMKMVGLE